MRELSQPVPVGAIDHGVLRGALAEVVSAGDREVVLHDLYDEHGAAVYEDTAAADTSEIRELVRLVRRTTGPILELAAGSGRLTLPLLRLRREVTAVELSPAMARLLQQKVADLSAGDLRIVVADMGELDLTGSYGAVVLGSASVSLLDAAGRARLLSTVAEHLSDSGAFFLSVLEVGADHRDGVTPLDGHADLEGRSGASYRVHYFWQPGEDRRHVGVYERDRAGPRHVYTSAPAIIDVPRLLTEIEQAGLRVVDRHPVAGAWSGFEEYFLELTKAPRP